MPAEEKEKVDACRLGVHFFLLNQPVGLELDGEGRISGLKLVRTRLGPEEKGRRTPLPVTGSEWTMQVDYVIEAIGNRAFEDSPSWYHHVHTDKGNLVVTNEESGATNIPGVFAGGDITRGPALVVEAVQDGKNSAKAILAYLKKEI